MKKLIVIVLASTMLTSCATVFGGKVTSCQSTKPAPGHHRQIRYVPYILDILLGGPVWLGVDFLTHAIYVPCKDEKK